ncbi:hypothetical protein GW17_00049811 [Ensete ventricosum]|nr:hypothetical protein GW17_00049811 [Ensete ventricosum]
MPLPRIHSFIATPAKDLLKWRSAPKLRYCPSNRRILRDKEREGERIPALALRASLTGRRRRRIGTSTGGRIRRFGNGVSVLPDNDSITSRMNFIYVTVTRVTRSGVCLRGHVTPGRRRVVDLGQPSLSRGDQRHR